MVHLAREDGGRPRVERVIEVTTDRGNLVVTPREQVDTEQVGVQGGERSDSGPQAEQETRRQPLALAGLPAAPQPSSSPAAPPRPAGDAQFRALASFDPASSPTTT